MISLARWTRSGRHFTGLMFVYKPNTLASFIDKIMLLHMTGNLNMAKVFSKFCF